MSRKLRVAVLISGGGSTLKNLIDLAQEQELDIELVYVVASNSTAKGLAYATAANIPLDVVRRKDFDSDRTFSDAIYTGCRQQNVELIVMGGFIKKLVVATDFVNRIINVHPSLIPSFCGVGYYGLKVHQSVIDYGCKVSGCTIHFVDDQYDHGPIISQHPVEVFSDDTAQVLASRVQAMERKAYPDIIQKIARGLIATGTN